MVNKIVGTKAAKKLGVKLGVAQNLPHQSTDRIQEEGVKAKESLLE